MKKDDTFTCHGDITAVESSQEVAREKIDKLESRLDKLKTKLEQQENENRKARVLHELCCEDCNLLFRGIPMREKSRTSETSEKIVF